MICYSINREVIHLSWTFTLHYLFPSTNHNLISQIPYLFVCLLVCCLRPPVEPKSHEGRDIVSVMALLLAAPRAGLWLCTICMVTQGPANSLPDTSCCKCDDSTMTLEKCFLVLTQTDCDPFLSCAWIEGVFFSPGLVWGLHWASPSFLLVSSWVQWHWLGSFACQDHSSYLQQWGWLFQIRRTEQW